MGDAMGNCGGVMVHVMVQLGGIRPVVQAPGKFFTHSTKQLFDPTDNTRERRHELA
jgi:hypothetical protein